MVTDRYLQFIDCRDFSLHALCDSVSDDPKYVTAGQPFQTGSDTFLPLFRHILELKFQEKQMWSQWHITATDSVPVGMLCKLPVMPRIFCSLPFRVTSRSKRRADKNLLYFSMCYFFMYSSFLWVFPDNMRTATAHVCRSRLYARLWMDNKSSHILFAERVF